MIVRTLVQLFPIWFLLALLRLSTIKHLTQARYEDLVKEENACTSRNENIEGTLNLFLDKALDVALDSFDNLFCRRCLVCIYRWFLLDFLSSI